MIRMHLPQSGDRVSSVKLAASLILFAVTVTVCGEEVSRAPEPRPVRAVIVQHHAEGEPVSLTGQVHAKDQTDLSFRIDGRMIERARCNAREAGIEHLVEFRQEDLFLADLREATVVTLFLFPEMNRRLGPRLLTELRPGTRIVSHRFDLGNWPPERTIEAGGHPVLLWTVPDANAPSPAAVR